MSRALQGGYIMRKIVAVLVSILALVLASGAGYRWL